MSAPAVLRAFPQARFVFVGEETAAGKFRVGRVIHDGPWQARSAAFPMLLNQFHELTATPVTGSIRIRDGRFSRGDGAGPASDTGSE